MIPVKLIRFFFTEEKIIIFRLNTQSRFPEIVLIEIHECLCLCVCVCICVFLNNVKNEKKENKK